MAGWAAGITVKKAGGVGDEGSRPVKSIVVIANAVHVVCGWWLKVHMPSTCEMPLHGWDLQSILLRVCQTCRQA